ncbi:MAG: Gldg family protein [Lentisphaerae bacterium]|nr:Gldg family protein [Lentisphaerota bacterium]
MKKFESFAFWKAGTGIAALLVLLAVLIAATVIVGNLRLRADLTEENLYTLSPGTKTVLRGLDRPVTLKLFFSASLPQMPMYLKTYARQVQDLLAEYEVAAGGRLVVETYDPRPDSDEEEWARRYGVAGQSVDMFGPPLYFGLVAVSGKAEAAVPALDPRADDMLEYTVTRLIHRVTHPEKPRIGVLSGLPVLGSQTPPFAMPGQPPPPSQPRWLAFRDIGEDYELVPIETDATAVDPALDAVVVIHPPELSGELAYALDQYVLGGGHLLVFLDPLCLAELETSGPAANPYQMPEGRSSLDPLLDAWGIPFDSGSVVADLRAASRIRAGENRVEESPVWLSLTAAGHINREDVLTAKLESLMLPFAGAFRDETSDRLTVTPLVTSSSSAGLVDARLARMGGQAVMRDFQSGGLPLNLALRVTGTFPTAFPDGKPGAADEDAGTAASTGSVAAAAMDGLNEGEGAVILVGDVDLLYDRFCVEELNFFGATAFQPLNDNLAFFANALEQMAGSTALIGIRSRGRTARPFDRVLELEEKARREWQAREEDLTRKLNDTRARLRELQTQKDESQRFILSKQQREAIERFKEEELQIQRRLKDVRKNLRRDIERLGIRVKMINIALVPVLVALGGVLYGMYRKRKVG